MQVTLRKVGNSQAVIIPKAILLQMGLPERLDMVVEENKIVLSAQKNQRLGWAAAAQQIAQSQDDEPLDFPLENDEEWVW